MRKCFSYSFIRSIFNSNILFFCCIFLVIKDKITVSDRWSINEISIFKLKGSNKKMDWKNIRLGRNIFPVKHLFWRKNLKNRMIKFTTLYHILYFEFTQNYGSSLNQKQPSIYPYFYSPQSTFLFAQM